jgi:hypothetical protein
MLLHNPLDDGDCDGVHAVNRSGIFWRETICLCGESSGENLACDYGGA